MRIIILWGHFFIIIRVVVCAHRSESSHSAVEIDIVNVVDCYFLFFLGHVGEFLQHIGAFSSRLALFLSSLLCLPSLLPSLLFLLEFLSWCFNKREKLINRFLPF